MNYLLRFIYILIGLSLVPFALAGLAYILVISQAFFDYISTVLKILFDKKEK